MTPYAIVTSAMVDEADDLKGLDLFEALLTPTVNVAMCREDHFGKVLDMMKNMEMDFVEFIEDLEWDWLIVNDTPNVWEWRMHARIGNDIPDPVWGTLFGVVRLTIL